MSVAAVILAAGKGTRMNSRLPKVLHRLCGTTMLTYLIEAVKEAGISRIVVVAGHGFDLVAREVAGSAEVVLQAEQLGTGHALLQAGPLLKDFQGQLLVLCGDTPLLQAATLTCLLQGHQQSGAAATVLTAEMEDPSGYGRIVRDGQGRVLRIVEHRDASPDIKQIREVNTGTYCFEAAGLFGILGGIEPANDQSEYYLTDAVQMLAAKGFKVGAFLLRDAAQVTGINDRVQLAAAEQLMRRQVLENLMKSGVTVLDPLSTMVDRQVKAGRDTVIYPFTIIEGSTVIGEDCVIGPSARLVNATVGDSVTVQNSIVIDSRIEDHCLIGPFSYLRPGTVLKKGVRIGDFVEIKGSVVGQGSKVPHLSYIGDAEIGENVNVGAGTITCNYDGKRKSTTRIRNGAFIGSNANLVAPLEIGENAVVGAGSTVTTDVPAGALCVERARQRMVPGWAGKEKIGKKEES